MATLFQSVQVAAGLSVPTSMDGVALIATVGDFVVPAGLTADDVIEFGALAAGHVPVDVLVAAEDLDSGSPAITLDGGLLSGTYGEKNNARTCGNEFFAASTAGQAGGIQRLTKAAGALIAKTTEDRGFGLKVGVAAATLVVGAKVRFTLISRPHTNGV